VTNASRLFQRASRRRQACPLDWFLRQDLYGTHHPAILMFE
jgi:hypothetical protein